MRKKKTGGGRKRPNRVWSTAGPKKNRHGKATATLTFLFFNRKGTTFAKEKKGKQGRRRDTFGLCERKETGKKGSLCEDCVSSKSLGGGRAGSVKGGVKRKEKEKEGKGKSVGLAGGSPK